MTQRLDLKLHALRQIPRAFLSVAGGRLWSHEINQCYPPLPHPRSIVTGAHEGAVAGDDSMNSRPILTALLLAGLTGAPITGASAERVNQNSAKAKAALEA